MRPWYCVLAALVFALALTRSADADVVVDIDRSVQRMAVTVDGVPRYSWRVSTARRGYVTPPGTYHPEMLARHAVDGHGHALNGTIDVDDERFSSVREQIPARPIRNTRVAEVLVKRLPSVEILY